MRYVGVTLLIACGVAFAQPKNKSTELFEQGRDLAKEGKFVEACAKFDESLKLERAPGTMFNFGDCLEHLGQLRRAWQMFDSAAKDFARDKDNRSTFAQQRADAVAPKLASILVKVGDPTIPGLVVKIGDLSMPVAAQINDRFEPGDIVVTATAPGKPDFSSRANGLAGSSVIVEIPAGLGAGGGAVGPFIDETPSEGPRDKKRVRIALITGGVGVVSFVTSIIVGMSAKSDYDDGLVNCPGRTPEGNPICPGDAEKKVLDDAGSKANIATGFAIGGGVLIGAAAVIFFTAPRESLQVTPTATASSVGVSLSGSF